MVNVLFFGLKVGEMSQMRSSIEYAFDVYRNKLAAFMLNINSVLRRMDQVDCFTDKLKNIHDQYRTLVKSIPVCWEHNEMMLRSLTNSNNFDLVYSILPFNSNTIYSHQTDTETTRKDSPESVSSYNSLEQLVIHLNRDWGVKGVELREALYKDGIIALLEELTEQQTQRNNGENTHNQPPLQLLLPGGGLGRLAVELSALNYSVEMNECSATMVTSFHSIVRILNKQGQQQTQHLEREQRAGQQQQSMQPDTLIGAAANITTDVDTNNISSSSGSSTSTSSDNNTNSMEPTGNYFYPYLNFPLVDDWDFGARFEKEHYPYVEDSPAIQTFFAQHNSNSSGSDNKSGDNISCNSSKENNSNNSGATTADKRSTNIAPQYPQIPSVLSPLSVQFGEFVEVYGRSNDHADRFDLVVTCFFIDTASSIFEYLAVIAHVLKPGGLWINAGPLHYHSQEAIPYSHSYMLQVIGTAGFDILSEKSVRTSYCGDDHINMKPEMYNIPVNAFKFNRPEEKYPINIKKSIQNAYNNSGGGEYYNNSTNSDSSSNSFFSDLDYVVKS